MKKSFTCIVLILSICLSACKTVPATGRKQMNLVPDAMLTSLAFTAYDRIVKSSTTLGKNDERAQLVERVGAKVQHAVETYMHQKGVSKELKNFKWDYNTIDAATVNAWCMPGGKVVVYTGLLPYTQNENALAVIMGHEIVHAIARHGNERMSQGLLISLGGMILQDALKEKKAEIQALFLGLYVAGSNLAMSLPNSRMQESEADHLGLIFATIAGYDPAEAIPFWQRMSANNKNKVPEFLSTHPSNETRIKKLMALIPEIKSKYSNQP